MISTVPSGCGSRRYPRQAVKSGCCPFQPFATERSRELAGIIVEGAIEVEKAVCGLRRRSELKRILDGCVEINRLENMADRVYRSALAELFENTEDIAQLIKWREIYDHLESATDRCEDVANVLEGVALKHA